MGSLHDNRQIFLFCEICILSQSAAPSGKPLLFLNLPSTFHITIDATKPLFEIGFSEFVEYCRVAIFQLHGRLFVEKPTAMYSAPISGVRQCRIRVQTLPLTLAPPQIVQSGKTACSTSGHCLISHDVLADVLWQSELGLAPTSDPPLP